MPLEVHVEEAVLRLHIALGTSQVGHRGGRDVRDARGIAAHHHLGPESRQGLDSVGLGQGALDEGHHDPCEGQDDDEQDDTHTD